MACDCCNQVVVRPPLWAVLQDAMWRRCHVCSACTAGMSSYQRGDLWLLGTPHHCWRSSKTPCPPSPFLLPGVPSLPGSPAAPNTAAGAAAAAPPASKRSRGQQGAIHTSSGQVRVVCLPVLLIAVCVYGLVRLWQCGTGRRTPADTCQLHHPSKDSCFNMQAGGGGVVRSHCWCHRPGVSDQACCAGTC